MSDAKRRLRQRIRDVFSGQAELDDALDAADELSEEEAEYALEALEPLFAQIEQAMAEDRDAAKQRN